MAAPLSGFDFSMPGFATLAEQTPELTVKFGKGCKPRRCLLKMFPNVTHGILPIRINFLVRIKDIIRIKGMLHIFEHLHDSW